MIDLTAEQRRQIQQSWELLIQHCKAVVRGAVAEITLFNQWNGDGGVGEPPVDHERAILQIRFGMQAQLLAHWGLAVPDRWLRVIYGLSEPEAAD